jgi:hypothetical protein
MLVVLPKSGDHSPASERDAGPDGRSRSAARCKGGVGCGKLKASLACRSALVSASWISVTGTMQNIVSTNLTHRYAVAFGIIALPDGGIVSGWLILVHLRMGAAARVQVRLRTATKVVPARRECSKRNRSKVEILDGSLFASPRTHNYAGGQLARVRYVPMAIELRSATKWREVPGNRDLIRSPRRRRTFLLNEQSGAEPQRVAAAIGSRHQRSFRLFDYGYKHRQQ